MPPAKPPPAQPLPAAAKGKKPPPAKAPRRKPRPAAGASPVIAQYLAIKADHAEALLFFRMGDFYELFFEDAAVAARALDIALTKRGKHEGADIPMCGVPVHAAQSYLARLIRKGHRVAVCEQIEAPAEAKKRGSKAVVKRDVVRVITQGTLTEDTLLDARAHNYLAALADAQGALGLAWLDISTGDFWCQPIAAGDVAAAFARIEPGEILLPERLLETPALFEVFGDRKETLAPLPASRFNSENARLRLEEFYGVKALDGFGDFGRAELAAAGALLDYVSLTQKGAMPRIAPPRHMPAGAVMEIDAATRRNLELQRTLAGERRGSLLDVMDETVTGPGARLLAARLAAPLTDPARIARRLGMVAFFVERAELCKELRTALARMPDMERALSRLTLGRGGPRDLLAIRQGLEGARALRAILEPAADKPEDIAAAARRLGSHDELVGRLSRALVSEPPMFARDGGFIASGYSPALDEQRTLRDESRRLIAGLENRLRGDTGIASLKIRHNNVLGFFIEVTAVHAKKLLGPAGTEAGSPFIHRQTMASGARFTTVELSELEDRISRAADKALALELALFDDLLAEVRARAEPVAEAAAATAALDVAAALAALADARGYTRPEVTDGHEFAIAGGRHPVVEAALAEAGAAGFVANDCVLSGVEGGGDEGNSRIWLVTGPNMAGKSTFLRQNALIAVMAQTGSFVPADRARIGVVDRLFSRVGAADDLARGRSTFMVEMVETAAILNQAGERALVILDEIGRGTATYDGLSIAWAAVEHLHEANRCRALFATHFHELTALSARLEALSCHTMRVKDWQGEVIFLHEVAPGAADRSYGIHVAELAGLPAAVIARAQEVLARLEQEERTGELAKLADDLPLFVAAPKGASRGAQVSKGPTELERALAELHPDELSPREALELLYKLKALAGE